MRFLVVLGVAFTAIVPANWLPQTNPPSHPNTISGRVLDSTGNSVPDTVVTLMERQERHGRLEYHFVDSGIEIELAGSPRR